jgi:general secretion pathway protein A
VNSRSQTPAGAPRRGIRRDLFGLTRTPFNGSAAPLYLDPPRRELCDLAEGFLQRRGFALVRGAPGCGKTRFLHHVLSLPDERCVQIAYVPFAMFRDGDLLRALCRQFNLEVPFRKSALIGLVQKHAVELGEAVNPVLVIDEVQLIAQETLDTLRILTNHRFEAGSLFTVFLCGGDDFLQRLHLRVNEPLRQRIGACWRLEPFDREHTADYIRHHLKYAGAEHDVFDDQAVGRIYDETRGVPRLINTLASAALEAASAAAAARVTTAHLDRAVHNLPPRKEGPARDPEAL